MDGCRILASILIFICIHSTILWKVVSGQNCSSSTYCCHGSTTVSGVTQITTTKSIYSIDEVIGYKCNSKNGHVTIKCQGSDIWSAANRTCEDQVPFSYASLAGILFALLNIGLETTFFIIATRKKNQRDKEEDHEMRVLAAAEATTSARA